MSAHNRKAEWPKKPTTARGKAKKPTTVAEAVATLAVTEDTTPPEPGDAPAACAMPPRRRVKIGHAGSRHAAIVSAITHHLNSFA